MRFFLGIFLTCASLTQAGVVFQQDFEAGIGSGFSGSGAVETTGGLSGFGFGQQHLRNGNSLATVLSLTGLSPHTTLTLLFDLAMWDSIDIGDTFQVRIDGNFVYNGTFGNYGSIQGPAGSTMLTDPATGFAVPDYGQSSTFRDSGHRLSFVIAHTGSTAVIDWRYPDTQGGSDESFGIDNIVVSTDAASNAVPEPSTWLMLGTGLGVLGLRRFRR